MNTEQHVIKTEQVGIRADLCLSQITGRSRSSIAKLMEQGSILCNGKAVVPRYKVCVGDSFTLETSEPVPIDLKPQAIPLDIVFQDNDLALINKQRGLSVHPGAGRSDGTLVNALLHTLDHLSGINGELRPGIVHRLDKDTTGLLIVAKNDDAHRTLSEAIAKHEVKREYLALVHGNIVSDSGTINAPIGRHPKDRKKMAVIQGGREAVTHYQVIERYGNYTLLLCRLETGRTHQIRVHMASIQHPVVRDPVYGIKAERDNKKGQLLHAYRITFNHPKTAEEMTFSALPPADFSAELKRLGPLPELLSSWYS